MKKTHANAAEPDAAPRTSAPDPVKRNRIVFAVLLFSVLGLAAGTVLVAIALNSGT